MSTTAAADRYFHRWKQNGTIERLNVALNALDRLNSGRDALPSVLCIDSQPIKLTPMSGEYRGVDAYKRVNGRKRSFVVDTQGRLWVAQVGAADQADGALGVSLITHILWRAGERLEKVFGDQAYNGVFARALAEWSIDRPGGPVCKSFPTRISVWFCAGIKALGGRAKYRVDEFLSKSG